MFEAAQIVNQRPIGRKSSIYTRRWNILCPNDLILGRSSSHAPQGPFKERVTNKHRFDHIQSIVQKKWSRDVFPGLVIRPKWHVEGRNVQKGDVVLIQDSNAVRSEWKLEIVSETFPGKDDRVRRVNVVYKNLPTQEKLHHYKGTKYTTIKRAVQRLIVLIPANEDDIDQ